MKRGLLLVSAVAGIAWAVDRAAWGQNNRPHAGADEVSGVEPYLADVTDTNPMPGLLLKIEVVTTSSGLKYEDLRKGTGAKAKAGDTVETHYTGWLKDGKKFDSSLDRGQPFSFKLGAGQVIKGWDEGVAGMQEGGKRKLIMPAKLAYGERGAGKVIPPDAELTFEIEVLKVK